MKIYLVGGAIRERCLNRPVKERDWVVVDSSPEAMLAQGFKPVGKAFPVFIHPKTQEEYALARTERKIAPGYHGFVFHTGPGVTLKEDLARRDLTINALAEDEQGQIIDYYGGLEDLKHRILRHITPAFAEDPVRVLRVARFAARYAGLGFSVAKETLALMKDMGEKGELSSLVAERVFAEWEKALQEERPSVFFKVLIEANVLTLIFPEFHSLLEPQPKALDFLDQAAEKQLSIELRFALFIYEIFKDHNFKEVFSTFINQYKIPNVYSDLTLGIVENLENYQKIDLKRPESIVLFYEKADGSRRFTRLLKIVEGCQALFPHPFYDGLLAILNRLSTLKYNIPAELQGIAIATAIREQRIQAIENFLKSS